MDKTEQRADTDLPPSADEVVEYRKALQSLENEGWTSFDDLLFKLAAGGLALSVTFVGVLRPATPKAMSIMFAAWGLLALSLLCLLLSVVSSQLALRRAIREIDRANAVPARAGGNWEDAVGPLNLFAGTCCFLGLLLFLVFAYRNL